MVDFSSAAGNKASWGYLLVFFGLLCFVHQTDILPAKVSDWVFQYGNYPIYAAVVLAVAKNYPMALLFGVIGVLIHLGDVIDITRNLREYIWPILIVVAGLLVIINNKK